MKTRIIIFTTSFYPFIGGAEIAVEEVAKRLKSQYEFLVITARQSRELPKEEKHKGLQIFRLGFGIRADKWILPFLSINKLKRLLKEKKQNNIFWGIDISQGSLSAAFAKVFWQKIPFIFTVQYGMSKEYLEKARFGLIKKSFNFILKKSDYVTTISEYLGGLAEEIETGIKAEIIHNGCDISAFFHPVKKNFKEKQIITTSRLENKNGIDILIRAVSQIKKKYPEIVCKIIGDGNEKNKLVVMAENLGISDNINFLGKISHKDIPQLLARADIFVRPSRSEGMGNSFIEAMTAGLPVLGTPVGGIKDLIFEGKTGFFAKTDDSEDLANKINYIFENPDIAEKVALSGQKFAVENFSWKKIAWQYDEVFKKTIASPPLKIVIATPLMPPSIGGPALYADNLSKQFIKSGHRVKIVSFSDFIKKGVFRHILYGIQLLKISYGSDLIFALDPFSVGIPSAIVSFFLVKPLVLRMEGDFLWEHYVERTRQEITLSEFYRNVPHLSFREKIVYWGMKFVFWQSKKIVFSSAWRKDMLEKNFLGISNKSAIIFNPVSRFYTSGNAQKKKIILWAGRMLYLKNLYRLINVFNSLNFNGFELHLIGNGPEENQLNEYVTENKLKNVKFFNSLSHNELLEHLAESIFFVLPSFSEVWPNIINEAISMQTIFLCTRESGVFEFIDFPELKIDPLDEEDIKNHIKMFIDKNKQEKIMEKIMGFKKFKNWEDVAKEWLNIFNKAKF